jgi:hypothetical protein
MLLQTDSRLDKQTQDFGCLHLSILKYLEMDRQCHFEFDFIAYLIKQSKEKGMCTQREGFLMWPQRFLDLCYPEQYSFHREKADYMPVAGEFVIQCWKGSNDCLHFNTLDWDPLPGCETVKSGYVKSLWIFSHRKDIAIEKGEHVYKGKNLIIKQVDDEVYMPNGVWSSDLFHTIADDLFTPSLIASVRE